MIGRGDLQGNFIKIEDFKKRFGNELLVSALLELGLLEGLCGILGESQGRDSDALLGFGVELEFDHDRVAEQLVFHQLLAREYEAHIGEHLVGHLHLNFKFFLLLVDDRPFKAVNEHVFEAVKVFESAIDPRREETSVLELDSENSLFEVLGHIDLQSAHEALHDRLPTFWEPSHFSVLKLDVNWRFFNFGTYKLRERSNLGPLTIFELVANFEAAIDILAVHRFAFWALEFVDVGVLLQDELLINSRFDVHMVNIFGYDASHEVVLDQFADGHVAEVGNRERIRLDDVEVAFGQDGNEPLNILLKDSLFLQKHL